MMPPDGIATGEKALALEAISADINVFPEYPALWARSEPLDLPGKFKRNRGVLSYSKSMLKFLVISV